MALASAAQPVRRETAQGHLDGLRPRVEEINAWAELDLHQRLKAGSHLREHHELHDGIVQDSPHEVICRFRPPA